MFLGVVLLIPGWAAARHAGATTASCDGLTSVDRRGETGADETPVVLVHGKGGSPDMWTVKMEWATGLSATRYATTGYSIAEAFRRMETVDAYVFDYEDHNEKWVTHAETGGKLRDAIDCLYEAYDKQVIVVAHSLGGLMAQYVAKTNAGKTKPADPRDPQIGLVISISTPYRGSHIATRNFGPGGNQIVDRVTEP